MSWNRYATTRAIKQPPAASQNRELAQQLRLKAEEAKKAFSHQSLFNEKIGDIWCTLDRDTFEQLILPKVQQTIKA